MKRVDGVNEPAAGRATTGGSGRREVEAIYPLSPTQHGLLFHALVSPGAYYQRVSAELAGEIDAAVFEGAWGDVVARHPVLRTAFAWEGRDEPLQVVGRRVRPPFRHEDWSGLEPAEQRERLRAFLDDDRRRGFDPRRAPLFRVSLIRLGPARHRFVWSHHHLILDGWSASRVLGEVFLLYRGRLAGEPPRLDPPRPYRDFIAWLRRRDPAGSESFWRRRLDGIEAPTPLPGALPPGTLAGDGPGIGEGRIHRALPEGLTRALAELARSHGLTVNTVVQGLWALLLGRHAGASTVLFGTTSAGRPVDLEGSERMIGLFITTLPVRVDLPANDRVAEWLGRLQGELAELGQHEHDPLVEIARWSGLPPGTPLFESLVVFENYPVTEAVEESGRSFEVRDVEGVDRAHYPLTLDVSIRPTLTLDLGFDPRRVDPAAAERVLGHFEVLAEAVAADPRRTLGALPMLTREELRELRALEDADAESPPERSVPRWIEEVAAARPERAAVTLGHRTVTYGELQRRAVRAADALRAAGAGTGTVVALLAERGPDFVAALLGVLRTGAVYLPLDPHHPPARLAAVLRRSGTPLAVVGDSCREVLPEAETVGVTRLALEGIVAPRPAPGGTSEGSAEGNGWPAPGDLAYVIYTSGSTGVPKGAMVTHGGMLNHLHAKLRDLDLGPADRVAQNASQSFDVSVWQLLAPLACGGTVAVFDAETARDPLGLLAEAERSRVTVLETVPSLLRAVLDSGVLAPGAEPPPLRWLLVTGEALPADLCRRWLELFPGVPLLNAYGPTECSDDVTHHPVERPPAPGSASVPIGRAIPNARLYVVDARGRRQPLGAPGELWVGGLAVGRGYLGDPGRTAAAFVPDPFRDRPGARAYRTGDLVRRSADGVLDFLGRLDHQVKVRGFRIELGEIESLLREHPAVAEAAVGAWRDGSGDVRLVAYPVTDPEAGDGEPPPEELRRHLRERLPEHMVPADFVYLDRLPLNDNGKLDRAALPEPDPSAAGSRTVDPVPPRSDTERAVAELWAEVLGRDGIGVHDNFFALGGHSLTATQLVSRVRRRFGVELTLADFFRTGSLAELATEIESALVTQADPDQIDRLLDALEGAS